MNNFNALSAQKNRKEPFTTHYSPKIDTRTKLITSMQ